MTLRWLTVALLALGCDELPPYEPAVCVPPSPQTLEAAYAQLEPCLGKVELPAGWRACVVDSDAGAFSCRVRHPDCPNGFCRHCSGLTYPTQHRIVVASHVSALAHELTHAITGDRLHAAPYWRCAP